MSDDEYQLFITHLSITPLIEISLYYLKCLGLLNFGNYPLQR